MHPHFMLILEQTLHKKIPPRAAQHNQAPQYTDKHKGGEPMWFDPTAPPFYIYISRGQHRNKSYTTLSVKMSQLCRDKTACNCNCNCNHQIRATTPSTTRPQTIHGRVEAKNKHGSINNKDTAWLFAIFLITNLREKLV